MNLPGMRRMEWVLWGGAATARGVVKKRRREPVSRPRYCRRECASGPDRFRRPVGIPPSLLVDPFSPTTEEPGTVTLPACSHRSVPPPEHVPDDGPARGL